MKDAGIRDVRSLQIIEAFDHFEVLHGWLSLLHDLPVRVTIHVSEQYRPDFETRNPGITFLGPAKSQSWPTYLQTLQDETATTWVIVTIGRRPAWFRPLVKFRDLYIVLHDLNYSFSTTEALARENPLLVWGKRLVGFPHRRQLHRLMQGAVGYLYPTPSLREYGAEQPYYERKRHLHLPFAAAQQATRSDGFLHGLTIVIPGAVRRATRDYSVLYRALEMVMERAKKPVTVHFAGLVTDSGITRDFNRLQSREKSRETPGQQLSVIFHPTGLSIEAYDRLLAAADILISPVRQHVRISGTWEILGRTKITGGFFDAIRFSKPLFVPDWYDPSNEDLLRYTTATDLAESICALAALYTPVRVHYSRYTSDQLKEDWLALLSV